MILFAHEKLADIWPEFYEIAQEHWLESEAYRHGQGFNPDRQRYTQYESMGCYFHFTAREDGKLVGSGGAYLMPSMHTQQLISVEDTYYLRPSHRRGRNAIKFFQFMEAFIRARGAVEGGLTTPLTNTKAERIVQFLGYRQVSKGWSKNFLE